MEVFLFTFWVYNYLCMSLVGKALLFFLSGMYFILHKKKVLYSFLQSVDVHIINLRRWLMGCFEFSGLMPNLEVFLASGHLQHTYSSRVRWLLQNRKVLCELETLPTCLVFCLLGQFVFPSVLSTSLAVFLSSPSIPNTNSITYSIVKFTSAWTLKVVIIHKKQSVPEYIIKGIFRKAIHELCCITIIDSFCITTGLKCESFSNSYMEMVHSFLLNFTNLQKSSSLRNSVSGQGLCR